MLLVLVGFLFATINAVVEEVLYRGVLLDALDRAIGVGTAALVIQAVVFGLHHFEGFPRGWVGVGLATLYGLAMGVVRRTSGGLLAAWVAHVLADIVIYAIIAFIAFGG